MSSVMPIATYRPHDVTSKNNISAEFTVPREEELPICEVKSTFLVNLSSQTEEAAISFIKQLAVLE